MKYRVKISSKGQIVIPKEIREKYGFRKGTEVFIELLDENRLIIERIPRLSKYFGILGDTKLSEILLREREEEIKNERERLSELGVE